MARKPEEPKGKSRNKARADEPPLTRVEDIMTADVVWVKGDATVPHIARLMHEKAISAIPVIDEGRRVIGIVTDLDLIVRNTRIEPPAFFPLLDGRIPLETPRHFKKRIQHMVGTTAGEIMTEGVMCVDPLDDVEALADLMVKRRVNAVPVVEGGRLVGIVARADVIRWMTRDPDSSKPAASRRVSPKRAEGRPRRR